MNEIKSLADQLREKLRTGEMDKSPPPAKEKKITDPPAAGVPKKPPKVSDRHQKADAFFAAIEAFRPELSEKSMIRVDARTLHLLKRMKLAKGVDMNRFIVYALHQYLGQHPWLAEHIQETLKNSAP
ncbi:hypothetical protein [Sphingobacterium sp. JB170]|uniref:hypothetical protein n=1 Tax=Sphingobacterium sp. JB170 TaxID=1434842 RepID=UPI00097EFAB5|nr:hypothetical protein [Sphingobacterium sp. JB170]SJN22483.1 hypothetical protein FM107_03345 [Sphingobacterium sp. JB170]